MNESPKNPFDSRRDPKSSRDHKSARDPKSSPRRIPSPGLCPSSQTRRHTAIEMAKKNLVLSSTNRDLGTKSSTTRGLMDDPSETNRFPDVRGSPRAFGPHGSQVFNTLHLKNEKFSANLAILPQEIKEENSFQLDESYQHPDIIVKPHADTPTPISERGLQIRYPNFS